MLADAEKVLEVVGKPLAVIAAVAYGVGVLIVNLFLSRHGVLSAAFLRTEYVLVGLLWCFLTSIVVLFIGAIRRAWNEVRTAAASGRYVSAAFSGILPILTSIMIWDSLLLRVSDNAIKLGDLSFYQATLCVWGSAVWLRMLWADLRRANAELGTRRTVELSRLGFLIMEVAGILGLLVAYATSTYPNLDAAIGGGRRANTFVVLSTDTPSAIRRALPRDRHHPGLVGPVKVLLETDHAVYVLPRPWEGDGQAVMLSRELVKGLLPDAQ